MAQYTINFSTNASKAAAEIQRVQNELTKVIKIGSSIKLSLDTSSLSSSINTSFRTLNKEIEKVERRLSKLQIGSGAFRSTAAALGYREGRRERGELISQPLRLRGQAQAFEQGSSIRLQKELQALRIEASQITPNTVEWVKFQQQIAQANLELQKADRLAGTIQLRENLGAFAPGSLARLEAKLTLLRNKAREISPNTTEWKKLNKEIQALERGISRVSKKPLTAGQRAGAAGGAFLYGGGLGGGVGSALGGVAGGLLGGVPGAFTGAAIGQAVDNLGQYAAGVSRVVAETNKARIALAGVSSDQGDYNTAVQAATSIGQKFLLPITDSTKQFTRLQASVRGAGFETKTTIKVFEGIASAIVATGGNSEALNSALLATSQVFSKGKVSAEELRQQIGERLPGAFTIFAQSIGKTPQELDKALSDGKVTLEDFITFVEELGNRYSSTAELLAKAPENAGPRLQVALNAATVSYGGFFQFVGAAFQSYFTDLVKFALENEKSIKRVITVFAIGFKDLGTLITGFAKFLVNVFNSAFSAILGSLDVVFARIEEAINRAQAAQSLTPRRVEQLQTRARLATEDRFGANIFGMKTGIVLDAQKAEKFYTQYFNNLVDAETRAAQKTSRTQKVGSILFPEFTPSQFGAGVGQVGGAELAGGEDGGSAANNKLKEFFNNRVEVLEKRLQAEKAAIDASLLLNEKEKNIEKARLDFKYGNLIVEEQLVEAARRAQEFQVQDRARFIAEQQELGRIERETLKSKFVVGVAGELSAGYQKLLQVYEDLELQQEAILRGTEELTESQKAEIAINKIRAGLTEKELPLVDSLASAYLTQAKAVDRLNQSNEKQLALRRALSPLEGQLRLAGILDPRLELRERIRQQEPGLDETGVEQVAALQEKVDAVQEIKDSLTGIASSISNSFGEAFKNIITGTSSVREALAGMFRSIADSFADMIGKMIAEWMKTQLLQGFMNLFSAALPGLGSFVGGTGIGQSVAMPSSVGMGAGGGILQNSTGQGFGTFGPNFGIRQFANGGMVTGPTLGLVGEGRYNEAIIPLPDGKSVPVRLSGGAGGNAAPINTSIVVNVKNDQAESQMSGNQGNQLARELEGAVRQVILKETRPGGLIAGSR